MKIGIIGAGFMARSIAAHALKAGHEVMLSNSRGPETLRSAAASLKCKIGTVEQAADFGNVIFLAFPIGAYKAISPAHFARKILVDLNNYYPERDGEIAELSNGNLPTSMLMAQHFKDAIIVKAFNAILVNHLNTSGSPPGTPGRRAIPIAGDNIGAKRVVADLIEQFGFDSVDIGRLEESWRIERARPAYCIPFDKQQLMDVVAKTDPTDFMPEYSWHG